MYNNTFNSELYLEATPSRWLLAFVGTTHSVALLIIILLPIPMLVKLGLCTLIALSALLAYRQYIDRTHPHAIRRVSWNEEEGWLLETVAGQHYEVHLDGSSFANRWLVVLNLRRRFWQRYSLILLPDNSAAEERRRVMVRIRLNA